MQIDIASDGTTHVEININGAMFVRKYFDNFDSAMQSVRERIKQFIEDDPTYEQHRQAA